MRSFMTARRIGSLSVAAALLAVAAFAGPVSAANKPDVGCMQAGIKTLQSLDLLDDVARGGITIEAAVGFGVAPRAGTDLSAIPNPIPFSLLLADHRAGDNSAFIYPWC